MRIALALFALLALAADSQAGPRGRRNAAPVYAPYRQSVPSEAVGTPGEAVEAVSALEEVNALRATRGLPAYVEDPGLTQAAKAAASHRARFLIFGHVQDTNLGDFRFVPVGTSAAAGGCAAYPPSYGWLSCAIWERNRYAGAAWAMGRDGKRYMHLFIR